MKLFSLRKNRNLSQAELAEAIGVDQTAVHLWESGKTKPRIENLMKLASYFNVSVDELLATDD